VERAVFVVAATLGFIRSRQQAAAKAAATSYQKKSRIKYKIIHRIRYNLRRFIL